MNKAEFIACSLAFHAALLVLALLLPPPFPSQNTFTTTDLTYVEVEQSPGPSTPEQPSGLGSAPDTTSLDPDIMKRLAPDVPGGLVLAEGTYAMGVRIAAAESEVAKPEAARATAAAPPQNPPKPEGGAAAREAPAGDSETEKTVPVHKDHNEEAEAHDEASGEPAPELTASAAADTSVGRVTTRRQSVNFRYQKGWPPPAMLGVDVDAGGTGDKPEWTAKSDRDWILVTPARGNGKGRIKVGVLPSGLETGYYGGTVRLEGEGGPGGCELAVSLMVLPEDPGVPELPHFAWDDYMDGGCQVCHLPKKLMPSTDFMMRPEFCGLCHNPAGIASESVPGGGGHPVMVNVTSGGARFPTGGTVASGAYSDKMSTHLLGGDRVVCVTCHNVMYKPGDYGRTWELASTDDGRNYRLAKGGWTGMGWLVPKVYVTKGLTQYPDRLSGLESFLVPPPDYGYDEAEGLIKFKRPPASGSFVYVTLSNPYLRMTTANNALCYDCHSCNTHQGMNCLVCHTAHGTSNIMAVREDIRIPGGGTRRVVFRAYSGENSFAGGGSGPSGICEICHTGTSAYDRDGNGRVHPDGRDYSGSDCTRCHSHDAGFEADAGGGDVAGKTRENAAPPSH